MRPCPHCGLPPENGSIYCAEGWQECLRRQEEIDADPMVTNLVYGNFEDPSTGRNAIVIQFQRGRKYKELVQMSRAVGRCWIRGLVTSLKRTGASTSTASHFPISGIPACGAPAP